MGYADVTSILPNPAVPDPSVRTRLRGVLSRAEGRRQSVLITETEGFRQAVMQRLRLAEDRVHVVANAVNGLALGDETSEPLERAMAHAESSADLIWAYPTRDYPHKNLTFLPEVRRSLAALDIHVRFAVTLRAHEWARQTEDFRNSCINVGELSVKGVGALMRSADAVFFPSLLEAFSATLIEALANRRLLFASDRDFVRSICGQNAIYFDPTDPDRAALAIAAGLLPANDVQERLEKGVRWVENLPSATERARQVVNLITGASPSR